MTGIGAHFDWLRLVALLEDRQTLTLALCHA